MYCGVMNNDSVTETNELKTVNDGKEKAICK